MQEHLIPAGLVERADERVPKPGGTRDALVYVLTGKDEAFLEDHEGEFLGENGPSAAGGDANDERSDRGRETDSEDVTGDGPREKPATEATPRLAELTERVARHENRLESRVKANEEMADRLDEVEETFRTVQHRLCELEQRLDETVGQPTRSVEQLDIELWSLATTLSSIKSQLPEEGAPAVQTPTKD